MQVSLTRDDLSIPWGFRLKGGAEYNVPLSILKVNDGSPAYMKLDVGDTILCIGSINASTLKHEEALNIFRMFDYNLPLTIVKERGPAMASQNRPAPLVWRPPSVSAQESIYSPSHQYKSPQAPIENASFYSPSHQYKPQQSPQPTSYKPTISSFPSQDMSAPISIDYASYQSNYKPQGFNSPVQQGFNSNNLLMKTPGSPSYSGSEHSANAAAAMRPMSPLVAKPHYEPPPAPPLPPPPMPGSGLSPLFNFKKGPETPTASSFPSSSPMTSSGHHRAPSESSSGGEIPSALLKAMNYSPMGKKPFTYTPGGLDLSHVRNSARVKRHDSARTHEDDRNRAFVTNSFEKPAAVNTGYMTPNLGPSGYGSPMHVHRPAEAPMYASQTNLASQGFNNYSNNRDTSAPSPSFGADHSFTSNNSMNMTGAAPRVYGTLPRNFREQKSSVSSFNPEEIKQVPKRSSESRDMANQSFSFRMLNKWIANSESSQPAAEEPKKVSEVQKALEDEQNMSRQPTGGVENINPPIYNRVAPVYSDYTPQPPQHPPHQPAYLNRIVPPSPVAPVPINQPAHFNKVTPVSYVRPVKPPYQTVMERKYSTDSAEVFSSNTFQAKPIYQAPGVPAREREQESEAPRYKGHQIPSKTFRYLQYLTETESVIQQSPKQPANPATVASSEPLPQAVATSSTNQATFLNETSSSFASNATTTSTSTSSTTNQQSTTSMNTTAKQEKSRVELLSEQHQQSQQQYQQQTNDTTSIKSMSSSSSHQQQQQEQSLSASLSHGLVLHESDGSALDNSGASGASHANSSSSAAVIFASDEPINTFVDLQSSEPAAVTAPASAESEPVAAENLSESNDILIETINQKTEDPEPTSTQKATPASGEPADESSSAQAVNIQQQQETAIGQEMAPITVTTETQSAPIEISDF